MTRLGLGVVVVSLVSAGTAQADGPEGESRPPAPPVGASPGAATTLSVGATVLGAGLVAGSYGIDDRDVASAARIGGAVLGLAGPEIGRWYAGMFEPTPTAIVRLSGFAVATGGVGLMLAHCDGVFAWDDLVSKTCTPTSNAVGGLGLMLALTGVATFVGGTAYELWSTPRDVEQHNAKRAARSWAVAPMVTSQAMGASVAGSF